MIIRKTKPSFVGTYDELLYRFIFKFLIYYYVSTPRYALHTKTIFRMFFPFCVNILYGIS